MKFSFLIFLFSVSANNLIAQQGSKLSQSELLSSFEIIYNAPEELSSTSIGEGKLGYYTYQTGVSIAQGDILALVSLVPDYGDVTPHVAVSAKIATLASNDQDYVIEMISPSSTDRDLLNADWVAHSYFVPKKGTGGFKYGKLTAMFREGIGLVYVYYLYNEEAFDLNELFQFMGLE